ncbi:MAG: hypothetical protein HC848_04725 [Limnobacter sp.]|nr:hypothetical protein [Limnobacter sp.]
MGEILGIDQRTVSALEKKPESISVQRLFLVLNALGIVLYARGCIEQPTQPGTVTIDQFLKSSGML